MKNISKKIILIVFILILLFSINTKVYALGEIISDGRSFIDDAEKPSTINEESLQDASGFIYNILLSAGVIIAVIVATVLGIQFMMSGAEGQAKVKEMIIPFVVGCIVVFGGFGIWKIALSIGDSVGLSNGENYYKKLTDGIITEKVEKEQEKHTPYNDKYIEQKAIQEEIDKLRALQSTFAESKKNSEEYKNIQALIDTYEERLRNL